MMMGCLLLMNGSYLTACSDLAFCNDQRTESSTSSASTVQGRTVSGLRKRPVTVADSIQMTRLGDIDYTNGESSKGIVAKFSPDKRQFVTILKKGNLEANTNEYSLVLFETAANFHSHKPKVLLSIASSSNRPAISNVHWLDDSDTIVFLGEHSGELTQLYSFKCSSAVLTQLTNSTTSLTSFVATTDGEVIIYTAENPVSTYLTEGVARKGMAVTAEWLGDIIRGNHGDLDSVFIKRPGKAADTRIVTQGRTYRWPMSLSPDGKHLLLWTSAIRPSDDWRAYEDRLLQLSLGHFVPSAAAAVYQYEVVDTVTGNSKVLFDAPIASGGSEMAWSPDSRSVVVSNVHLPLDVDDTAELELRKAHAFLVEYTLSSERVARISQEDLRLIGWDSKTGYIECDVGMLASYNGQTTPKVYFQKSADAWRKVSPAEATGANPVPDILLDEGMNKPPHIVAVDPSTGQRSLLMDLNPLFHMLAFGRVEEITWKGAQGHEVKGGLYWPVNYVVGAKYPLIVQTHGWHSDRFWIDGPYTTGYAAQTLAGKGFFVLQLPDPDFGALVTSKEMSWAMAAYEGAIDSLNARELVDRSRIGIMGFSRTCWYVTYALTHSKHQFAVAAIADGQDYGYSQYLVFANSAPEIANAFEEINGGPPFGDGLSRWGEHAPEFRMDRIRTPLRIQSLGPDSLLIEWHWYSGLSRLGKPVELIYIPDGTHVLEKPWDRMVSQQGNVDWFCFWLKGEEDPDPTKAEQYVRWRGLRKGQEEAWKTNANR